MRKLLIILILLISVNAYAQDNTNRLEELMDERDNPRLTSKERATAYFKLGQFMLENIGQRTATVNLIVAVDLDPDNQEYRDFLIWVYDEYWKDSDYSGDDPHAIDFQAIKNSIMETLNIKKEQVVSPGGSKVEATEGVFPAEDGR